jgi:hypothetical protein
LHYRCGEIEKVSQPVRIIYIQNTVDFSSVRKLPQLLPLFAKNIDWGGPVPAPGEEGKMTVAALSMAGFSQYIAAYRSASGNAYA